MKLSFAIIISLFLLCCTDDYEHSYRNFEAFNKASLRLQSWFPSIIGPDCYDLREIHTIGDSESYGKFSYTNDARIDSLLNDSTVYQIISAATLFKFLERFKDLRKPSWFLDKTKLEDKLFYKHESMCFIQNKKDKTIYFAYTLK